MAPKHEMATMIAKRTPPKGPKRARPKSKATVLLRATVSWGEGQGLILWEKTMTYFVKDGKVGNISEGEQYLR